MFDSLKQRLRQHEGVIPHLYLDTRGLVTVGVGHLIVDENACAAVPLVFANGTAAPRVSKVQEYRIIHAMEPAHIWTYYAPKTQLHLTDDSITFLLDSDVAEMFSELKKAIPDLDQAPEPAQDGLLDMAFSMGVARLQHEFPKFMAAAQLHDWATCAVECRRNGVQEWRNTATADLFRQASAA